jgi:hypothetical protein
MKDNIYQKSIKNIYVYIINENIYVRIILEVKYVVMMSWWFKCEHNINRT